MSIQSPFERIESLDFAIEANLASGWRIFERFISSAPEVKGLAETGTTEVPLPLILNRFLWLAQLAPEEPYENPYDVALAAYFWVIHQRRQDIASGLKKKLQEVRNTQWARRMAVALAPLQIRTDARQFRDNIKVESWAASDTGTEAGSAVFDLSTVEGSRVAALPEPQTRNDSSTAHTLLTPEGLQTEFTVTYVTVGSAAA